MMLSACSRQPPVAPAPPSDNYFKTQFQDESQFIVETVLTDLAELAAYVRSNRLPANISVRAGERSDSSFRQPNYDVTIAFDQKAAIEKPLQVNQPIWAPELYQDFAGTLVGKVPVAARRHDAQDLSVLVALLDLRAETLEAENDRVSRLLEKNFTDPTLHEMAAVILGALALRESSGYFYDIRLPLCRLTAHLTLARTLSGGTQAGVNGQVAEAMLFTLMNNQKTALDKIKALGDEPKLQSWVRALRVRNTQDYSELQGEHATSQLEWMTYFLAISRSINPDAGWAAVPQMVKGPVSDFCRIANAETYSVGLGHELRELALARELAEIKTIHALVSGEAWSEAALPQFLNQIPERCFIAAPHRVRIIGPGQWAMFLQRHLCHTLGRDFNFLQRMWGVPEVAKEYATAADQRFGSLRLYPFVRRFNCLTEAEYHAAVDAGMPVTVATPHLVSPDIWNHISSAPKFAARYNPSPDHPHVNEWHKHNPPPGTAYNPAPRMYHPSLVNRPDAASVLGELAELAPYDGVIADWLLWTKYRGQETFAQAETVYRPVLDYAARPNLRLTRFVTNDPPRYEQLMVRYAAFEPSGYFTLGRYFAGREDEGKAVTYYEKGVELDSNDVRVANNCDWLVNYYFEKGKVTEAEALADRAAEVYSLAGLRTKADLLERQKKYDEAFKYFFRIEERYERSGPLVGFCVRYKVATGETRFDGEIQKRFKTLFPRGIEKVGLPSFKSAPEQGVLIAEENALVQQAGLKKGDIIVALDDIRIYDMTQYQYVRGLTNAPELRLLVWDGTAYAEKKASPPNRRFGVTFTDFYQPTK